MKLSNVQKRFIPNAKSVGTAPFFTMRLVDMKAWQLYVGQSLFIIFMGLLSWLIISGLNSIGLSNKYVDSGLQSLTKVTAGDVTSNTAVDAVTSLY